MATPPLLKLQIAWCFSVHLRVEIVGLGPVGVGRIEILKIRDEPGAIEFPGSRL